MEKEHIDFTLRTKSPVTKQKGEQLEEYIEIAGQEVDLELVKTTHHKKRRTT